MTAGTSSGAGSCSCALTEPGRHNASHGLVRWANWTAAEHEADRVVMALVLHPQPGYPFTLGLSVEYRLGPGGLSVATTATNLGDRPCPFGAGAHPYLTVGTDTVDDAILQVPAGTWLWSDERGIPMEQRPVANSPYRFDEPRPIGDLMMDTAFTDLTDNEAVLAAPDGQRRVRIWWDASYRWLMVFTGDTLEPARRRRSVAIEPMTCAPNAFVTGDGLRVLEPERVVDGDVGPRSRPAALTTTQAWATVRPRRWKSPPWSTSALASRQAPETAPIAAASGRRPTANGMAARVR